MRDVAKRFNADFEREFKRGDARPKKIVTKRYPQDGRIFQSYVKTKTDPDGFYLESWILPREKLTPLREKRAKEKEAKEIAEIRKRLAKNIIEEW
jgi:hypothetical protein